MSIPETITLAHGEGGLLARTLIEQIILPTIGNETLRRLDDSAVLTNPGGSMAMTTDSFVVSPLFFPGGSIGTLAVYGTVNDLAVSGARPQWLSLSFIIEEGLSGSTFQRVLEDIAAAAEAAHVQIVTGDTKVVPRGAADQLFINTSGVGVMLEPAPTGPSTLEVGDELVVTGDLGRHGIAVLASREDLGFDPIPASDCAPLFPLTEAIRAGHVPIRAMRDATRGGLAAVLHEWAAASRQTLHVDEAALPTTADVRGICELLGLDPVHLPNEGTMLIATSAGDGERVVAAIRALAPRAAVCGRVEARSSTPVTISRGLGRPMPLDFPVGQPLPRIC